MDVRRRSATVSVARKNDIRATVLTEIKKAHFLIDKKNTGT